MFEILGSYAFLGPLRDADSSGENAIFRGKIEVGSNSVRCYIKPFPAKTPIPGGDVVENRSIVSEALGYALGRVCGFSMASNAGVIILQHDQIPAAALDKLMSQTPGGRRQDEYFAWFSEDMRHPALMTECPSDAPELLRLKNLSRIASDLATHKSVPGIVSFDEWTENSDRHLGNLLGGPGGELMLIDHGRLFRHPSWTPELLEASPLELRNALLELIDSRIPNWSTKTPIRSARSMAYKAFSLAWKSEGKSQTESVLNEFMDPLEVTQVLDFLSSRLEPSHYTPQVGLMI